MLRGGGAWQVCRCCWWVWSDGYGASCGGRAGAGPASLPTVPRPGPPHLCFLTARTYLAHLLQYVWRSPVGPQDWSRRDRLQMAPNHASPQPERTEGHPDQGSAQSGPGPSHLGSPAPRRLLSDPQSGSSSCIFPLPGVTVTEKDVFGLRGYTGEGQMAGGPTARVGDGGSSLPVTTESGALLPTCSVTILRNHYGYSYNNTLSSSQLDLNRIRNWIMKAKRRPQNAPS